MSHAPFDRILAAILSHMLPAQPTWLVSEYMTPSDENHLEKRCYSSDELLPALKANGGDSVDYACFFATAHADLGWKDAPGNEFPMTASAT